MPGTSIDITKGEPPSSPVLLKKPPPSALLKPPPQKPSLSEDERMARELAVQFQLELKVPSTLPPRGQYSSQYEQDKQLAIQLSTHEQPIKSDEELALELSNQARDEELALKLVKENQHADADEALAKKLAHEDLTKRDEELARGLAQQQKHADPEQVKILEHILRQQGKDNGSSPRRNGDMHIRATGSGVGAFVPSSPQREAGSEFALSQKLAMEEWDRKNQQPALKKPPPTEQNAHSQETYHDFHRHRRHDRSPHRVIQEIDPRHNQIRRHHVLRMPPRDERSGMTVGLVSTEKDSANSPPQEVVGQTRYDAHGRQSRVEQPAFRNVSNGERPHQYHHLDVLKIPPSSRHRREEGGLIEMQIPTSEPYPTGQLGRPDNPLTVTSSGLVQEHPDQYRHRQLYDTPVRSYSNGKVRLSATQYSSLPNETAVAERAASAQQRQLLQNGQAETQRAMASGQAHVVQCRGCGGRLHAPMTYSMVFCPNCRTVSPGQTIQHASEQAPSSRRRRGHRKRDPHHQSGYD